MAVQCTYIHSALQLESVNSKYFRRTCVNKCENKQKKIFNIKLVEVFSSSLFSCSSFIV